MRLAGTIMRHARALAELAGNPQRRVVAIGDPSHEGQAQPDAFMPARQRTVELRKQPHDLGFGARRHAHAIVADFDDQAVRIADARRSSPSRPAR